MEEKLFPGYEIGICCACGENRPIRFISVWQGFVPEDGPYCYACSGYYIQQANIRMHPLPPVPPEFMLPAPPHNPELN